MENKEYNGIEKDEVLACVGVVLVISVVIFLILRLLGID